MVLFFKLIRRKQSANKLREHITPNFRATCSGRKWIKFSILKQLDTKWHPKSPKWRQNGSQNHLWVWSGDSSSPKLASAVPLAAILVDFGIPLAPNSWILATR